MYRSMRDGWPARPHRPEAADCLHQLGNVSCLRGDYDGALDWYRQSLGGPGPLNRLTHIRLAN